MSLPAPAVDGHVGCAPPATRSHAHAAGDAARSSAMGPRTDCMPSVTFVIPAKRSERTIGKTVQSILSQHYAGDVEIIVVADPNDSTWGALEGEMDAGKIRVIELRADSEGRDTSVKRNAGFDAANGDVLCTVDSDVILPPDWLCNGVALIDAGWQVLGGPVTDVHHGFVATYIDKNPMASKMIRVEQPYVCSAQTFGRPGEKPPITGNAIFTRAVWRSVGGFDPDFIYHYDDYEWFYRVVRAGFEILCTPTLRAGISNRENFSDLVKEYRESGRGCAQFVRKHPDARLARQRALQVLAVVAATTVGLRCPRLAAAAGLPFAFVVGADSVIRSGRRGAVIFPAISGALGMAFTAAFLQELAQGRRQVRTAVKSVAEVRMATYPGPFVTIEAAQRKTRAGPGHRRFERHLDRSIGLSGRADEREGVSATP